VTLVKKIEYYTMSLQLIRLSHRWLMGLKQTLYVGFSIENKMVDLNTCTYLGFSIKYKIQISGGLWFVCGRRLLR